MDVNQTRLSVADIALPHPLLDHWILRWFLMAIAMWEFLFHRLFGALGLYSGESILGGLELSGQYAMNALGIAALVLTTIAWPKLLVDKRQGPFALRILLLGFPPWFLPAVAISAIYVVSFQLIFFGLIATVLSAFLMGVLCLFHQGPRLPRWLFFLLGLVQILTLFESATVFRVFSMAFSHDMYRVGESLFVLAALLMFFSSGYNQFRMQLKRPHVLGLLFATCVTLLAILLTMVVPSASLLANVAYRTLGFSMPVSGAMGLYFAALFMGALFLGISLLPSRKWPPTLRSRRLGMGYFCLCIAGVGPSRPYLFMLMVLGMIYLAIGSVSPIVVTEER